MRRDEDVFGRLDRRYAEQQLIDRFRPRLYVLLCVFCFFALFAAFLG
jgi:hypothetical protein